MTSSKSTEIQIATTFQTTCQSGKIALDYPEKSARHKEVGQSGWGVDDKPGRYKRDYPVKL